MEKQVSNKDFHQTALDFCGAHLCIINDQGEIVYVNHHWKEFAKANNSKTKHWLGLNYLEVCENSICAGDEYAKVVKDSLKTVLNGHNSGFQIEYPCHSPNEKRWFLLRAVPFHCDEALYVALYHEQFIGDEDLRVSQRRLALAVDSCSLGIWEYDLDSGCLDWNHWMYAIYGVNPVTFSLSTKHWQDAIHAKDRDRVSRLFNKSIDTGADFDTEFKILRPSGEVRTLIAKAQVIKDYRKQKRLIGVNIDISEKKKTEETIRSLAYYDQITKLPNRKMLSQKIKESLALSSPSKQFNALLFIDLDNFKRVNDSAGHVAGDELLRQTAQRLQLALGDYDFIARIGGDEFVIILQGLGVDEFEASKKALGICNDIHIQIKPNFKIEGHQFRSSASIGVTLFNNAINHEADLLREAELAMYRAKEDGKGSTGFYHSQMQLDLSRSIEVEHDLQVALEENQLFLVFQPQILEGKGIVGAEILVRWQHPTKGLVSPLEFISIAEDCGLILPLGNWIFEQACKIIASWQTKPLISATKFAINISPKQLQQESFPTYVKTLLARYHINPQQICLELTEGVIVENVKENIAKIDELKSIGISFSIDDFGTGYSSLSYLKKLPINQVKIDKSFVDDLLIDESAVSIAKAIIALGNSLDLNVLAEGVENEEQKDILRSLGCFSYQGYFYAKPLSAEEYEGLFALCDAKSGCNGSCKNCIGNRPPLPDKA